MTGGFKSTCDPGVRKHFIRMEGQPGSAGVSPFRFHLTLKPFCLNYDCESRARRRDRRRRRARPQLLHVSERVLDLAGDLREDLSRLLLPVQDVFGLSTPQLAVAGFRILAALSHLFLLLLMDGEQRSSERADERNRSPAEVT